MCSEEYAQFYGAMNTMNGRMVTMRKDGLPYEDMGYVPPPNRCGTTEKIKANVVQCLGSGSSILGQSGSRVFMTKIKKKLQLNKKFIFF